MDEPLDRVVAGQTALMGPYTCRSQGLPFDLTGMQSVSIVIHRESGAEVTPAGALAVLNQVSNKGQVTYAPAASDFTMEANRYTTVQRYQIHIKVVDAAGKIAFFPRNDGEVIEVARP